MDLDVTSANNVLSEPIRSFSTAMSLLQQHSFTQATNFQHAAISAKELYHRTHEVVNMTDISNLQAAHSRLDPKEDFLAYISTLHASLAAIEHDSPILTTLLQGFTRLVEMTDGEWARAIPQRWVGMARHAVRLAIDTPNKLRAISLISSVHLAATKLLSPSRSTPPSPSSSTSNSNSLTCPKVAANPSDCDQIDSDELVPLHADFLALCIHAKYYRYASKWISNKRRLYVNPSVSQLTATDVHLIYHYSTWVYIGMKNFSAALQTCRLALVVPAPSPGSFYPIVVTTYKLYVLLHLLELGKCPLQMKFSSHQPGPLRKMCSEYIELGHAFESDDLKGVLGIVEKRRETFVKHETYGLVKQVVGALYKRIVNRMCNCYVKMTMKQMADKLQISTADTHRLLLQLIQWNELKASIDQRLDVVKLSILDDDLSTDQQHLIQQVSQQYMKQCLDIMSRLRLFIDDVECDPDYIKKEMAGQSSRKQSTAGARAFAGGGAPGLALGMADIDAELLR